MHPGSRALREKIEKGLPVIGAFLVEFSGPAVVSATANAGFDFVMIDGEHGNQNPREIETSIEAGYQAGLCTIMRPPDGNRAVITRSLDAGVGGVLVPFCSALEDARQAVLVTKYMPIGKRGVHLFRGHTRHQRHDTATFMAEANRDLLTIIQIELAAAVPLVDQIAAMVGVDGLYIGPGDLSVDLGVPGQWEAPVVLDAIRATAAACRKHGKIMCCHVDKLSDVAMLRKVGVQMFGYYCDIGMYSQIAVSVVSEFRKAVRD
jgi:2-dehydro-3-deoxyglucarate aldolase/4-hydroxy-2-oxoheptanedioate aldolase